MAFTYDETTRKISMPPGDTASIHVKIDWAGLSDGDAVLFAIVDRTGEDLLVKAADVTGGEAEIRLCNHDTRDIEPGNYKWQLRIVTSPARDDNGNVIADECGDHVLSVFGGDSMPVFRMERGGARV